MISKKVLVLIVVLLFAVTPFAVAQIDYCEGDYDCDGDQDGSDAFVFKSDFGRSSYDNPCPSCVPLIPVAKTGQTECYDELGSIDCVGTGQDGEYQLGYARFTDNADDTVTDTFTKLMWLKDANCLGHNYIDEDIIGIKEGATTWQRALDFIKGINDGTFPLCGAGYTDWRLPNIMELNSLTELKLTNVFNLINSVLPLGHPFTGYQHSSPYWSSTSHGADIAFCVSLGDALVHSQNKLTSGGYVWPVRGGH